MFFQRIQELVQQLPGQHKVGTVLECTGLIIKAELPDAFIGELCQIRTAQPSGELIQAEVVGFRDDHVLLMSYAHARGVSQSNPVYASGSAACVKTGEAMLGRVVDAFGNPLDGGEALTATKNRALHGVKVNPMLRAPICETLVTGVRSIDAFATLGKGQRIGLMAGSGVGKSTLLASLSAHVEADVNVIALIGERGREVEEFVNKTLGDGIKSSVVVAADAQESALTRVHAAYSAVAIAESFAEQGKDVVLMLDSITRFAMSLREIGLAAGEPSTVKGYTPSVFSALPNIIERCGNFSGRGSISAIFTVLVDSDDFTDPVVDAVRAILDGHIVLSRELAERNHYPAIDISKSISRLFNQLNDQQASSAVKTLKRIFKDYLQNKDILELGLFASGNDEQRNALKGEWQKLEAFLTQNVQQKAEYEHTYKQLLELVGEQ